MVLLKPGFIPATALSTISPGTQLVNSTAAAWRNMALAAELWDNTIIRPVDNYGSGYRSWAIALDYYHAGQGDIAACKRCNIDPNMKVNVAYPPGSHGSGTRIDLLFNGHSPADKDIELAKRYGFTQEFGTRDENHFMHDGQTAIHGVRAYDSTRLVGRFLNQRHLGRTTDAERTGERDANLIWLVQHYGHLQKIYPANCIEDGITGPHTEVALTTIWGGVKHDTWHSILSLAA